MNAFCVIYDKNCLIRMGAVTCTGRGWWRYRGIKTKTLRPKRLPSCLVYVIGTKMQLPPCPPWAELAPSAVWMTRGGYRFALVLRGLGYVCYINNSGVQSLHMHTSMFYDKNCIRQHMVLLRESCM